MYVVIYSFVDLSILDHILDMKDRDSTPITTFFLLFSMFDIYIATFYSPIFAFVLLNNIPKPLFKCL